MANPQTSVRNAGFSMVEMLVALVFTMVLMAGMASVFKASLSTLYTTGEAISSQRRNRISTDLLSSDLDTACMYLADLTDPPAVDLDHPPFYILPNMAIPGDPNGHTADQLYFQVDQPLPFEGALVKPAASANSAATVIANGGTLAANNADNTFNIDCINSNYASQVVQGQTVIFKDSFDSGLITNNPQPPTGSVVTVVLGTNTSSAVTGTGSTGLPLKTGHIDKAKVVFAQLGQIIRYQVQYLQLDPTNDVGIPCLVRDQGTYVGGVFTPGANNQQQIVAENVSAFKVYLSVNAGQSWAGWAEVPQTYTGMAGWNGSVQTGVAPTGGILSELATQLTTEVTNGFTTIGGNADWFRSIPTAVRVDVTTRTATQRSEYSTTPNTAAYKTFTQSLIYMPRHSGLPLN